MDPRHKLSKSLDQLFVDSQNPAIMSARTDDEAARNAASSGVTPEAIKQKLVENLGATHVEIEDMSGMLPIITMICISLLVSSFANLAVADVLSECHETTS
jgi:hypothetical protein